MYSLKFKFVVLFGILFVLNVNQSNAAFTDDQCLQGDLETRITHSGQPMGLMDTVLNIKKSGCVITIEHTKFKIVKKKWVIDVCRGPVHIKYGNSSVDVLKRKGRCNPGELNDFCPAYETLSHVLQDDGLIFAEGERENITEPHGQVFCAYLLIRSYLSKGMVFSKGATYNSVLERNEPIEGSMFVKPQEPESNEVLPKENTPVQSTEPTKTISW